MDGVLRAADSWIQYVKATENRDIKDCAVSPELFTRMRDALSWVIPITSLRDYEHVQTGPQDRDSVMYRGVEFFSDPAGLTVF